MKKSMLLSFVLVLGLILNLSNALASPEDLNGQVLPDFSADTINNTTFTLSESLKTHDLVLINFWATWCGPCRMEFPALEMAWEQYSDRVDVIALSIEKTDTFDKLTEFAGENNLEFLIGRDDSQMFDSMGGTAIPTTIIVDKNRRVVAVEIGAKTSPEDFTSLFDSLLNTSDNTSSDESDQLKETASPETSSWNCPECGRIGNTRNYCGRCGHARSSTAEVTTPSISNSVKVREKIQFGHYYQPNEDDSKSVPIEWYVLSKKENCVLLLSVYGIDNVQYHTDNIGITWAECDLRRWLNSKDGFLGAAFTNEEIMLINDTYNKTNSMDFVGNKAIGGDDTVDKVFLLSLDEFWEYVGEYSDWRYVKPTEYALSKGANVDNWGEYRWWLRTPGGEQNIVCDGKTGGAVSNSFVNTYQLLRPAIWVKINE